MNLYFVNKLVQDVIDEYMDRETGEITEEGSKKLESLGLKKEEITHELILAWKNAQQIMDGIKAEQERLAERMAILTRTQNSVMKQLRPVLVEGEKVITPEYELKWTTSTKLDGLDNFDPELEFASKNSDLKKFVVKKVPDPVFSFDKNAIKAELKKEGCRLPTDIFVNQTKNPKIK